MRVHAWAFFVLWKKFFCRVILPMDHVQSGKVGENIYPFRERRFRNEQTKDFGLHFEGWGTDE